MVYRHRIRNLMVRWLDSGHLLSFDQCVRCWAWLPLGPARDTDAVLVELRAADLADAGFGDWREIAKAREEVDGLIAFERNREAGADVGDRPMWHAGWLAGAILFHDREQRQQVLL